MMLEVIDQYGERHRFDDTHCIHDESDSFVKIGKTYDDDTYDVVATFPYPAMYGQVTELTCLSLREVPPGIARNLSNLEAENARLRRELSTLNETLKLARQGAELVFQQLKESEANAEVQFQARKVIEEQLAAAQVDAARYRWLRNPQNNIRAIVKYDDCKQAVYEGFPCEEQLDIAIDSAMKGEQP